MMNLGLRVTDQETARVVSIHHATGGRIVGAGCLVSNTAILTCRHVVESALGTTTIPNDARVTVTLTGVRGQPKVNAVPEKVCSESCYSGDLALLRFEPPAQTKLAISAAQFAAPLRHSGKTFYTLGFPEGSDQGLHANGSLHGADASGLVQMDGTSPLLVEDGFSGAPVWSPELGAFVGLVVAALGGEKVAWCIPSRVLCSFYPDLPVRFRIPPTDRPTIHDQDEDDPNIELFGMISNDGSRKLTAKVTKHRKKNVYTVRAAYRCLDNSPPPRGSFVTFITYPDFRSEEEDAYELFATVDDGGAEVEFYPNDLFTIAAIGDGGDTALTLDLCSV